MPLASMFENRLRKNARHYRKWAQRQELTAYRLYDRDIPEYPYVVEWYDGRVHLVEYPRKKTLRDGSAQSQRAEVLEAVTRVLEVPEDRVFTKTHLPKAWGKEQYGRLSREGRRFEVREHGLRFWVNLTDYLDTGLFLDHRNTRARVREEASGKRVLNLFAYTGAFTVHAAAGGAKTTTTVDLSRTYLEWAKANLELNGLSGPKHTFVAADALQWLSEAATARAARFDLVVLDPPSFSTSKKMAGTFEVQRAYPRLLASVDALLPPGGVVYFSTNYEGFSFEPERVPASLAATELTPKSIPEDFHHREIHRCWRMVKRPA